jgi:hypothetical protein
MAKKITRHIRVNDGGASGDGGGGGDGYTETQRLLRLGKHAVSDDDIVLDDPSNQLSQGNALWFLDPSSPLIGWSLPDSSQVSRALITRSAWWRTS